MKLNREIEVPPGSDISIQEYAQFLFESYEAMSRFAQYFSPQEDVNSLELAHIIPTVRETVLAVYLGINDAVCNKGLVTALLARHGHNNVFVFDPQVYSGGEDVPSGTEDAAKILNGFEPPNATWDKGWTYVMIADPARTFESLWAEKGYIDMIPAKFEDFTMLTEMNQSRLCTFIDPAAFEHPVNAGRGYLDEARERGRKMADEFTIPAAISDEADGLEPVVLEKGQKLFVARHDFAPCAHMWTNIHPDNEGPAVVNENSAVPLGLITAKPPVNAKYAGKLAPPAGSADMTTDWFYRGSMIVRTPLLAGTFKG